MKILSYENCSVNLGDTIQAIAICRLLPKPLIPIARNKSNINDSIIPFVINGYICDNFLYTSKNTLFAGIYIGNNTEHQLNWIRQSQRRIGSRDPFTHQLLKDNNIPNDMIGCPCITLPKYNGKRFGEIGVDLKLNEKQEKLTSRTKFIDNWNEQWQLGVERLERLKTAELVVTRRLHAVLPCLAMGTPVLMPSDCLPEINQNERFSLLNHLGFKYDVPNKIDLTPFADNYKKWLSKELSITITEREIDENFPKE